MGLLIMAASRRLEKLGITADVAPGTDANTSLDGTRNGSGELHDTLVPKAVPPIHVVRNVDTLKLLQGLVKHVDKCITQMVEQRSKFQGASRVLKGPDRESAISFHNTVAEEKREVVRRMRDVIAEATDLYSFYKGCWHSQGGILGRSALGQGGGGSELSNREIWEKIKQQKEQNSGLQVVGLIPKQSGYRVDLAESGHTLLAIGVFSRESVFDDKKCSLRRASGKSVAECGGDLPKQYNVFALEGLADTAGLSERAARPLLSKIAKYARKEKRFVVLSKRAYTGSDGTDLTEYYVRLGFKKVVMDKGHELVYTAFASFDDKYSQSPSDQVLISMSLWDT